MEAISGNNNDPLGSLALKKHSVLSNPDSLSSVSSQNSGSVSLTDLSELADRVANSSNEIRPEAVENAMRLMNDPNWPNDSDIDKLADKLLKIEDFS